jgi:hypothetical protein
LPLRQTPHPALIPQETAGGSRQYPNPARQLAEVLLTAGIPAYPRLARERQDRPPFDDTHSSVPTSVEAQDRFLDLLTATGCEVAVDANASEPSFLQYSKRTDVVRGRSGVQWAFGSLGKKNL